MCLASGRRFVGGVGRLLELTADGALRIWNGVGGRPTSVHPSRGVDVCPSARTAILAGRSGCILEVELRWSRPAPLSFPRVVTHWFDRPAQRGEPAVPL